MPRRRLTPDGLPLAGIRVVDTTTSLAGPYCTLVLGALGADVIKVERPGAGDDTRAWMPPAWDGVSAMFLALNANKRSIVLDLKADDGRQALLRLASTADVFVHNFAGGVSERLGVGFKAIRARSPRIVYCAISAFGPVGPLADRPGYDPLMQAMSGIMSVTGEEGRDGVRAGVSVVDQGTGLWAAIGILAALRLRERLGTPQLVSTSLFEAAVNWLPYHVAGYLGSGATPTPQGTAVAMIAPYERFATADGSIMIAAANDALFARLCDALQLPHLRNDPRFQTNPDRVAHRHELMALIEAALGRETTEHWLDVLTAASVPTAPILDVAQMVAHPQTEALGLLQDVPEAPVDGLCLVAPPLTLGDSRVGHRSPPPALGRDTRSVLQEIGYSESEIEALADAGVVGPAV